MKPTESFAIRSQDLVIMGRNKTMITTIKTFDHQVGRVTSDGVIIKEEGLNAANKESYTMVRLWRFNEIFPKIKCITQRKNVEEKFKQKAILIADRRFPNQKLMTLGNGKYIRPSSSAPRNSKKPVPVKKANSEKKKENKVEKVKIKEIVNEKYKGLCVNRQVIRSLSFGNTKVSAVLNNSKKGYLRGDYFVEEVQQEPELLEKYTLIESCLSQISKIIVNDTVLAERKKGSDQLLTTGAGWDKYYKWLPEQYRKN